MEIVKKAPVKKYDGLIDKVKIQRPFSGGN